MKRLLRRLKCRVVMALDWSFRSPFTLVEFLLTSTTSPELRKGIQLIDPNTSTRSTFVDEVDAALDLIAAKSPIRYARVLRQIRFIYHMSNFKGADYDWPRKFCTIDLERLFPPSEKPIEDETEFLACLLIYAATHGHLARRGVIECKGNFQRVEHLCNKEMVQFAESVGIEWLSGLLEEEIERVSFMERIRGTKEDIRKTLRKKY
ncbi:MAG: hypothetical protein JWQ71_3764 [Pedosphaera sp.]|nr:hypothetical protein [Pedosphaera sp.]